MDKKIRGFEKLENLENAKLGEEVTAEDILLPLRGTISSAGYDFFATEDTVIPSMFSKIMRHFTFLEVESESGKSLEDKTKELGLRPTLVPTGIKAYMPNDECLQLFNRSSGSLKRGLIMANSIGLIDADYYNNEGNEGHIFFQYINYLPFDIVIKKGEAIGQGVFTKYGISDRDNVKNEKRAGGFGSTDVEKD